MAELRRVAVLVEHRYGYFREILRGIQAFARQAPHWVVYTGEIYAGDLQRLRRWRPHGIVGHPGVPEFTDEIADWGVPIVAVTYPRARPDLPQVVIDEAEVGRLAAEHFLARGFRQFAFAGEGEMDYAIRRRAGFEAALDDAGISTPPAAFLQPKPPDRARGSRRLEQAFLKWLSALPRPLALFACNDSWSHAIGERCREAGVRIPEEVALLGVDNDDLVCELSSPALSSIETPSKQIGYEAARLLDRLMAGEPAPERPVTFPPIRVVARRSTDAVVTGDADVTQAVDFIARNAHRPIGVEDILSVVPMSRRLLEKRFRTVLGRTPLGEIHRARVERAKHLLIETDAPMPLIAERAGFPSVTRMGIVFRRTEGCSPSQYRRRFRIC